MRVASAKASIGTVTGDTIIAPGAPEVQSWAHRALNVVGDVALAIALVWSLPLAVAIGAALVQWAVAAVR